MCKVTDVQKARNKQHIHSVEIESGILEVGMSLHCHVDEAKRKATTANHSCTHLLQSALKKVVGEHIHQAGSYVCDEYLRFDFNHFEKLTTKQLDEIEDLVNQYIAGAYPVTKEIMDIEEAKNQEQLLYSMKNTEIAFVLSLWVMFLKNSVLDAMLRIHHRLVYARLLVKKALVRMLVES